MNILIVDFLKINSKMVIAIKLRFKIFDQG